MILLIVCFLVVVSGPLCFSERTALLSVAKAELLTLIQHTVLT
jgi:hypothetical protein